MMITGFYIDLRSRPGGLTTSSYPIKEAVGGGGGEGGRRGEF